LASLITHPVVPFSLGVAFGRKNIPLKVLFIGMVFSMLPDADVIAFRFGIPYEHMLGHRGISHSLFFAAAIAFVTVLLPAFREMRMRIFLFLFMAAVSHGVLDAMTSGGRGVGFFIPITDERYFFSLRPIRVSPLNVKGFFTERGLAILWSELIWVWLPCAVTALAIFSFRKWRVRD
jgi:inner membrane protein